MLRCRPSLSFFACVLVLPFLAVSALTGCAAQSSEQVVVKPQPYPKAFKNPLKGMTGSLNDQHPYATLARPYVRWDDVEGSADDGVEKVVAFSNKQFAGRETRNMKVIPRVSPEWPKGSKEDPYWPTESWLPSDMRVRDFTSAKFKARAAKLIAKLGQAWDNDPRVAFIEMGLIGPWGEQHHPGPTEAMQKVLGDAFTANFKNKLVMNRYPWHFQDYKFGIYWDSFGKPGWEIRTHVPELEGRLAERWKIAPMGGEMAFDLSGKTDPNRYLGKEPTDALANHVDTLIRYFRRWHWTCLGWIGNYDPNNPQAAANADRVQQVLGYRFVIDQCRYPATVRPGGKLDVTFTVRNVGSAPFYYNWPVEVSLLDSSRKSVWKATFKDADIRAWMPGNFSDIGKGKHVGTDKQTDVYQWDTGIDYDIPAQPVTANGQFLLPPNLPAGQYILAIAILDPAGNLPSARFAIANYFTGGRHPMGRIGIGCDNPNPQLDAKDFDDLVADQTLHYVVKQ